MDVGLASPAPELLVQANPADRQAQGAGVVLDVGHRSELPWSHHLVLIQQEDGNSRGRDQLIDLRSVLAKRRPGVAID